MFSKTECFRGDRCCYSSMTIIKKIFVVVVPNHNRMNFLPTKIFFFAKYLLWNYFEYVLLVEAC